jgi:large subunit ribosomal protein L17
MIHRNAIRKLGRTSSHRKATLNNLMIAAIEKKHIKTTVPKAKETRKFLERMITLAKSNTVHARRIALKRLKSRSVVKTLFDDVAPRYVDRPGGYTRVIKLGQRSGDGAPMALLELVGYEMALKKKQEKEAAEAAKKAKKKGKIAKDAPPELTATETEKPAKKKEKAKEEKPKEEKPKAEKKAKEEKPKEKKVKEEKPKAEKAEKPKEKKGKAEDKK